MKNAFKIFGRVIEEGTGSWETSPSHNVRMVAIQWQSLGDIHFPCEDLLKGNIEILFIYSENGSFSTYYYKDGMYILTCAHGKPKVNVRWPALSLYILFFFYNSVPLSHLLNSKNLKAYFNHLPMGQHLKSSPKLCVLPHTDTKWCFS